ncbi:MAG: DUF6273 domain-containing protein [Oscillospiraceae bacterium]|nr:DUF6273 domain-containing protein [Oscillospiraceae bacterium]
MYGNRVLVISDKLLDESRPYHEAWEDVTWADSSLRAYLNGEYYNSFSSADRARIVQVINKNDDNQWFYTPGGVDTQDRIFLLSLEEVVKHFGDSVQLANGNPNNSYWIDDEFNDNRATHSWDNYPAWWWLRSPGVNRSSAACVGDDGNVFVRGLGVIGDDVDYRSDGVGGVRPALWLRLGN